jgi:hypothetical protein
MYVHIHACLHVKASGDIYMHVYASTDMSRIDSDCENDCEKTMSNICVETLSGLYEEPRHPPKPHTQARTHHANSLSWFYYTSKQSAPSQMTSHAQI